MEIVENVPATALWLRFRVLLCVKRLAIPCAMPKVEQKKTRDLRREHVSVQEFGTTDRI